MAASRVHRASPARGPGGYSEVYLFAGFCTLCPNVAACEVPRFKSLPFRDLNPDLNPVVLACGNRLYQTPAKS